MIVVFRLKIAFADESRAHIIVMKLEMVSHECQMLMSLIIQGDIFWSTLGIYQILIQSYAMVNIDSHEIRLNFR